MYVDRILSSDDSIKKQFLKEKLAAEFEMKELGRLMYFIGVEVAYSIVEEIYP